MSIVREALVGSVMCRPPSGPPVMFQMHPGVHVAEHQVARLGLLPGAVDVVEDPADLRPREVGGQRQPDLGLVPLGAAAQVTELLDDRVGAGVLPDDRVVHRLAGRPVPDQRGLALVGDPDGGDVRGLRSALASAPAVTSRVLSQISFASCSTQPARGKICSCSFWSTSTTRPSRLKIMHRVEVVPWSIAATYCSLICSSPGRWCRGSGVDGEGAAARHEAAALTASIRFCAPIAWNSRVAMIAADDRPDDRHPGVAPVRRSLALDRQDRVGDARTEVTGRVDGVPGGTTERLADADDQQRHEQRADLGRACRRR